MYPAQFLGGMYPFPLAQGSTLIPPNLMVPMPISPMVPMPVSPIGVQGASPAFPGFGMAKVERGNEIQELYLQSQKQQLLQLKNYIAKYADSIEEALAAIEEEISKSDKTQEI